MHVSKKNFSEGKWLKIYGKNLNESKIGIVGFGRIGFELARLLRAFNCKDILVNDININKINLKKYPIKKATKNKIFKNCNIITLHLPLTKQTKNLITKKEINLMRSDAILINTSRGGIINENHLASKYRRIAYRQGTGCRVCSISSLRTSRPWTLGLGSPTCRPYSKLPTSAETP